MPTPSASVDAAALTFVLVPLIGLLLMAVRLRGQLLQPVPMLALVVGWSLSGWVAVRGDHDRARDQEAVLTELTADAQEAVESRMNTYVDALRSGASFLEAASQVNRRDWDTFANTLDMTGRYPGINGIGVIFPVDRADAARWEAARRDDVAAEFRVHAVPGAPPSSDAALAVITYIFPLAGNEAAQGLDIASEDARRTAAFEARDTGEPRMTSRVTLVQDVGRRAGFLLFVPVYEQGRPLSTPAERRAAFRAWVYAPFVTERFLEGVLGSRPSPVQLHVFEGQTVSPDSLLYATAQTEGALPAFARTTRLTLAGRTFTLGWNRAPGGPPPPLSPLTWVALLGAVITLFFVGAAANEQDLRHRVASLVAERTALLRQSELRYRELVERLPDPTYVVREGVFLYMNPAAVALFGASSAQDLLGTTVLDRIVPEMRPIALGRWDALLGGQPTVPPVEARLLRLDGTPVDVEIQTALIDYDGAPAIQIAVRDMTERKEAQRLVQETQARYQQLFEQMLSAMLVLEVICDAEGRPYDHRFLYANPAFESQTGLKLADQIGKTSKDLGFQWPQDVAQRLYAVGLGGAPIRYERYNESLGRFYEVRAFSPTYGQVALSTNEISERKRAENALLLRSAALDAAANAIVITDRHGVIQWVNRAFCDVTGYSLDEAIGSTPGALLKSGRHDAAFYAHLWDTILNGGVWSGEMFNRRKDGTIYPSEITITPVATNGAIEHFIAVEQDITQRRRMEEQFRQAQKMESIGRLAGGIAHDFNNMLAVIIGVADLALVSAEPNSQLKADLQEISDAARRSAELTRQLLTFARKQSVVPERLDLNGTVGGSTRMLQRLIGEHIQLKWEPATDLWPVFMDPSQLDQILANLCVNARDAIDDVGTITIATANCVIDADTAAEHVDAVPGDYVCLSVADTGRGIPAAILGKIFEPFFTTKGVGEGTGLGLSTVYGAVRQAGGFLTVTTAVGAGTTFSVHLPRCVSAKDDAAPSTASAGASRGRETILVVEDEPLVLRLVERTLASLGYRVLSANSPSGALSLARAHGDSIDLLLTDVVMPEMSGRDLASAFRSRFRRTKLLFMSGFPAGSAAGRTDAVPLTPLLNKPFDVASLSAAVRKVLDGHEPAEAAPQALPER